MTATTTTTTTMTSAVRDLLDRIDQGEHLRRRVVQEAIADALACTWTRRADQLADALPRPGDHPGGPVDWHTGAPLAPHRAEAAATAELRGVVSACRAKAALLTARWLDE